MRYSNIVMLENCALNRSCMTQVLAWWHQSRLYCEKCLGWLQQTILSVCIECCGFDIWFVIHKDPPIKIVTCCSIDNASSVWLYEKENQWGDGAIFVTATGCYVPSSNECNNHLWNPCHLLCDQSWLLEWPPAALPRSKAEQALQVIWS